MFTFQHVEARVDRSKPLLPFRTSGKEYHSQVNSIRKEEDKNMLKQYPQDEQRIIDPGKMQNPARVWLQHIEAAGGRRTRQMRRMPIHPDPPRLCSAVPIHPDPPLSPTSCCQAIPPQLASLQDKPACITGNILQYFLKKDPVTRQ